MRLRNDLLQSLALRFNPVVSKRLAVVFGITGSAGLGKTWLLQTLLRELKCRSLSVQAAGHLGVWLKNLPRPKKLSALAQSTLARAEQNQGLEDSVCVKVLLEVLSELAPFVLHLEDIHEASPERLELLEELQTKLKRQKGLGLIVTSRHTIPDGLRHAMSDTLTLEPLDQAESKTLLQTELGAELPAEALQYIDSRALGNPLFLLEYLRFLTRQGLLWSDGKVWHWRTPNSGFMPMTIEALLENLLLGTFLKPNHRLLLEVRSLLSTMPLELWSELTGLSATEFAVAKAQLEAEQILIGLFFAHPLFQEVMRGLVPLPQLQTLVRRILQSSKLEIQAISGLLEELTGLVFSAQLSLAEEEHWLLLMIDVATQTGQKKFLVRCKIWLAERREFDAELFCEIAREVDQFDSIESERLYRLIVQNSPNHLPAAASLSSILCDSGQFDEAHSILSALPAQVQTQAAWLGAKTRFLVKASRLQEAIELYTNHPEIMTTPDIYYVAYAYYILGDLQQALSVSETRATFPLEDYERAGFFSIQGGIFLRQGKFLEALDCVNQQVALAKSSDNLGELCTSLRSRAMILPRLKREQEAYADVREAMSISQEIGDSMQTAMCLKDLSQEAMHLGQFQKAEALLLEADTIMNQFPPSDRKFYVKFSLSELYLKWQTTHHLTLAQKYARAALAICEINKIPRSRLLAFYNLAIIEAKLGHPEAAMQCANQAWQVLEERQFPPEEHVQCLSAKAHALEANGQVTQALLRHQEAVQLCQQHQLELRQKIAELEIARLTKNSGLAQELAIWFKANQFDYFSQRAEQYFPELVLQTAVLKTSKTRLNILGTSQLLQDGQPIHYRGNKRLEFLVHLLEARVAGQSEVLTSDLIDQLYPDFMETEAKAALKQLVYLLRNSLGADVIQSTPKGYALGAIISDVEDFLETRATHHWRGIYAADLPQCDQSNLRERLVQTLRLQIEILIETDALETARLGEIYLRMEPYDRDMLELTLRAMKRLGQPSHALYQEAIQRFLELGEMLPPTSQAFLGLSTDERGLGSIS